MPGTMSFPGKISFEVIPIADVPLPDGMKEHRPLVLIVDDEEVIAETLAVILSHHGFATMTAYDGKSALDIARAKPPDVLLSDVMMPGLNGIELAIAVSREIIHCKILLFSGQTSTLDLLEEARANGYSFTALTKPIHPKVLVAFVTACLKDGASGHAAAGADEIPRDALLLPSTGR
jgi:DNA-binding response OmpR family regulator